MKTTEQNEIFLGYLTEQLEEIINSDDQELSIMLFAGNLLNKLGYTLASGKNGATNELWAIQTNTLR